LSIIVREQSHEGADIYLDSPVEFLKFLKYFNINVPSLSAQIRDTAIGVR